MSRNARRRRARPILPRERSFGEGPATGRDLPFHLRGGHPLHAPYITIPPGTPLPDLAAREHDHGPGYGVRIEIRCPHCGKWLCQPDGEVGTIYEDCLDHSDLEGGPSWPPS